MNSLTVILKPTNACNLRCHYCYAANMHNDCNVRMDKSEIEKAFQWLLDYCRIGNINQVKILWHGGEPMLCGAEFIKQTVVFYTQLFKENGISCKNAIQTNLTLLDSQFVELFKEHFDSRIGFSFDYHSPTRCDADGRDVTSDILNRIRFAQQNNIELGTVSLLTSYNKCFIAEMYAFFKTLGIPFVLSRIACPETPTRSAKECADMISNEDYIQAVCQLFDLWFTDPDPQFEVTGISAKVIAFLRNEGLLCSEKKDCSDIFITLAPGGLIFPCGKFDSNKDAIGSFLYDHPDDIWKKRKQIISSSVTLNELGCLQCKYYSMCYGGCCHARMTGWQKQNCITSKAIWDYFAQKLVLYGLTQGCLANLSNDDAKKLLQKIQ